MIFYTTFIIIYIKGIKFKQLKSRFFYNKLFYNNRYQSQKKTI